MNDDRTHRDRGSNPPGPHPDVLLASYVEGTSSTADRAAVKNHLERCERCRAEVAVASTARDALRSLPELPSPGVAGTVSHRLGLDRDDPEVIRLTERRARRERVYHAVWASGFAAAAVLAGVLIYLGVVSNPKGGQPASAPVAQGPVASGGSTGQPLTAADVDALVRHQAALEAAPNSSRTGAFAPAASPAPGKSLASVAPQDVSGALLCLQTGSGLTAADRSIEVFQADFDGTPAYVGLFETQGGRQVTGVVVSQAGCQPLYLASQPR